MTEEDSKYLAEKMGLCWHEPNYGYWIVCSDGKYGVPCKSCGIRLYDTHGNDEVKNIDFSSEHGFFVVFEWAKKQEWWIEFVVHAWWIIHGIRLNYDVRGIPTYLIGLRLAEEVVAFLKGREK